MGIAAGLSPALAVAAPPASAAAPATLPDTTAPAGPVFTPQPTAGCVAAATAAAPSRSGFGVLDCAGRAAAACMAAPGGDTTVGMVDCLGAELRYWDERLEGAYAARRKASLAEDGELKRIGATAESLAGTLAGMQQAWLAFRDAACRYEQAQWLGGTGGGPAGLACQLQETARQTLKLEGWWAQ